MDTDQNMTSLVRKVSNYLKENNLSLVTAESCTGGWVAKVMTDLPGSSDIFDRGFVTYSNQAKQDMLGVSMDTLETYGAVSEQVVVEMVEGALENSRANLAIAISGIAGPGGGSEAKPVGTVCFAWMYKGSPAESCTELFAGDRDTVRSNSVEFVLEEIIKKQP